MPSKTIIGSITLRAITIAAPVLTVLEIQLQQHSLDPWALGASAVAAVIVAIAHLGSVTSLSPATKGPLAGPPGP